ncbi:methylated-DNA--[protein]-cysteine S-methyltransferase [Vibrio gallicus]|uniref:methylated-DNA--[protein]-cysteine S-methyltransferase n=1 Tax=Vibrio gallicus TaxID=190897 RepID=UPI0021C40C12|nr:methylated-DNA--[protein]-cysteine S-methyltransferase [Vibrio gallicus]
MHYFTTFASRLGSITAQCSDKGITGIWFEQHTTKPQLPGQSSDDHPYLQDTKHQLTQYFANQRRHFDLPLDLQGTAFQLQIWEQLTCIPFGETRTYKQLAEAINNPQSVRAVGAANGKNPISIIVPCHRVIGVNRTLTGYAGGIERKQALLELEGITVKQ